MYIMVVRKPQNEAGVLFSRDDTKSFSVVSSVGKTSLTPSLSEMSKSMSRAIIKESTYVRYRSLSSTPHE